MGGSHTLPNCLPKILQQHPPPPHPPHAISCESSGVPTPSPAPASPASTVLANLIGSKYFIFLLIVKKKSDLLHLDPFPKSGFCI